MATEPDIRRNDAESRYELGLNGERVGVAEYVDDGTVRTMTHTVVDPAHGGRGLGSALVRFALDDIRSEQRTLVPECSMVRAFIRKHAEYEDLLEKGSVHEH